jgi:hypothetical protein
MATGSHAAAGVRSLGICQNGGKCGTGWDKAGEVEDNQRLAGRRRQKMSKSYAGQSSNGLLLTTVVRQGTI